MTALQKIDAPEVVSQSDGLLAVIARAAADPNVDIDKLERLLAAQERVQASKAKEHYVAAKLAMRPHLPEITMKGKITIKKEGRIIQETPFARFEDIHEAVTPILTEYGFDLSFRNGMAPDGKVRVTTILTHVDGHSEETYFDLPHDSSGSKNAVQAIGSSTSYAKRYGALSILNIRVCGEDDNADTAVTPKMEANERINNPKGREPTPRAEKWEGAYSGKSALHKGLTLVDRNIRGCGDSDELEAYLQTDEFKDFVASCERYSPHYLHGGEPAPVEFVGINKLIDQRRSDFNFIENSTLRAG
jgi:hypothetical protein